MLNIYEWFDKKWANDGPWLIIGKGPSFGLRDRIDLSAYSTIALNHVVTQQPVLISHIIDMDVVDDCRDALAKNAEWLLMPFHPHVEWKASDLSLKDFVPTVPLLEDFDRRGQLLWYNLHSGKPEADYPVARGTFSASVVVNLLGLLGVKDVRSLGVDGGNRYSDRFSHLADRTLMANGHSSFDIQFREIESTTRRCAMSYKKVIEPIRVFVGADDSQMVAGRVLEHSIRMHTKHPVEVFFMCNMPVPPPKHAKNRPGTGFSFNRFLIPKLAGYRGRAIYLDADMLVFDDIEKLWNTPLEGNKLLCSTQTETPAGWEEGKNNSLGKDRHWTPGRQISVMLMDCEKLNWDVEEIIRGLDEDRYSYKDLMATLCILDEKDVGDTIPSEWNCLEWYEEGRSCLVHFTVVPTQPWKNDRNALDGLWTAAFKDAVAAGAVPMELITDAVARQAIKPSLMTVAEEAQPSSPASGVRSTGEIQHADSEASELRRMLWHTMISNYKHEKEIARMGRSVGWNVENVLVRKPTAFGLRAARAVGRSAKRLLTVSSRGFATSHRSGRERRVIGTEIRDPDPELQWGTLVACALTFVGAVSVSQQDHLCGR